MELLTVSQYQNHQCLYGNRSGASGAIYVIVAFAFMFPCWISLNIIVPIKAKYFVPGLVLVDLYLGVSGQSILVEAVSHILLTLRCFIWLSNYVVLEEESV
jgi:membrane associated rhomboid family serine protease